MKSLNEQIIKRNLNRCNMLHELYRQGPLRRTQLAERLLIRKSSITSIAEELLDNRWLTNIEASHPRSPLCFDTSTHCLLAISYEITCLKAFVYTLDGNRIHAHKIKGEVEQTYDAFLTSITSFIDSILAEIKQKPLILSLALPGIIDSENGFVIKSENAPQLTQRPVVDDLEKLLALPVLIENDIRASLLSALWFDVQWVNLKNAVYIDIAEGVSAAILINATLYKGSNLSAGEIGHLKAGTQGHRCSCGKKDCLETYISIPALAKSVGLKAPFEVEDIAREYRKDANKEKLDSIIEALALILRPLIATVDPEIILLGNQLSAFYEVCISPLQEALEVDIPLQIIKGNHSTALTGVVSNAFKHLFSTGIGLGLE